LPENLKALRVWSSRAKYCQAFILEVEERDTKEKYLVSVGNHLSALLGND
jgi:hypothetical protein